ncbi:MAG: TerB family tellurite resistance protein, partial [Victivallales bacterium]|nr:TerB family tellurite resistance protein [Victivallales bacterium]
MNNNNGMIVFSEGGCAILIIGAVIGYFLGQTFLGWIPLFGPVIGVFCGVKLASSFMAFLAREERQNAGGNHSRPRQHAAGGSMPEEAGLDNRERLAFHMMNAMGALASADGYVSPEETRIVCAYFAEFFPELSGEQLAELCRRNNRSQGSVSFAASCRRILYFLGGNAMARISVLELFCEVAFCDGELSDGEQQLLRQAEVLFGIPGFLRAFMARKQYRSSGQPRRNDEECLRILGCSPDASDADIKKAWRTLC